MRSVVRIAIGAALGALGLARSGDAIGEPTQTSSPASSASARTPAAAAPSKPNGGAKKSPSGRDRRANGGRKSSRLTLAAQADVAPEPLIVASELPPVVPSGRCPADMVSIDQRYCVDRYEGSLVEVTASGDRACSPFMPVDDKVVRAVSVAGVFPQGYISGAEAQQACMRSGKRLCKAMEWRKACAGPSDRLYGYAESRERGRCNDAGRSPMLEIWHATAQSPASMWDPLRMNDPRLNQLPGSLSQTGAHASCTSEYGVFDMVGNLHEWIDDPSGTFQGGYYLDTSINGEGCSYRTTAHPFGYHDYSTGFRCCADMAL